MLLDVKNVSVRFASGHGVQAVENVSLTVNKKEKVCIVGETGSGKSILLLAILHLLPENAIVTGEAFFEGEDMIRMKRRQLDKIRGARISYVPQGSGNGLNPLLTVGFQVAEPMIEHQKIGKKEAIVEAVKLMKRFHIGGRGRGGRSVSLHLQRRHEAACHDRHGHHRGSRYDPGG